MKQAGRKATGPHPRPAATTETDPTPYDGKEWTTAELCRLHGPWHATHGAE